MAWHIGVTPFKCPQCGASTTDLVAMTEMGPNNRYSLECSKCHYARRIAQSQWDLVLGPFGYYDRGLGAKGYIPGRPYSPEYAELNPEKAARRLKDIEWEKRDAAKWEDRAQRWGKIGRFLQRRLVAPPTRYGNESGPEGQAGERSDKED